MEYTLYAHYISTICTLAVYAHRDRNIDEPRGTADDEYDHGWALGRYKLRAAGDSRAPVLVWRCAPSERAHLAGATTIPPARVRPSV